MTTVLTDVPEHLRVGFNVYEHSLAMQINDVMRDYPPVSFTPANGGHWIVTGYSLVHAVLTNPQDFPSFPQSIPPETYDSRGRFIPLEYDPPMHGQFRQMLLPLFSPARVTLLRPRLEALADDLIDGFIDRGECEFIHEFASPFPATVFLTLMGWPLDQREQFSRWVNTFIVGDMQGTEEESNAARTKAVEAVYAYFGKFVTERWSEPGDDFTGALLKARMPDGRALTEDEVLNFVFLLMIAGLHTVQGSLAYAAMYFSRMPDVRNQVISDAALLDPAIEEILRMEPPAWGIARGVARDMEFHGVRMKAGDVILLPVPTSNRDGDKFEDADEFRLDRQANPHLTFGGGPHRCMGSHLARFEMNIALSRLHARIPEYNVDFSRPISSHMGQVRGIEEMHLTFPAGGGRSGGW